MIDHSEDGDRVELVFINDIYSDGESVSQNSQNSPLSSLLFISHSEMQ